MHSVIEYEDFRKFLKVELDHRRDKNARYSLRAFARDVGVSQSRISEILAGAPMSVASAQKVANGLKLSSADRDFFVDLVRSEVERFGCVREIAAERLQAQRLARQFVPSHETMLKDWYSLPLIEFITLPVAPSLSAISRSLATSVQLLERKMENLIREGFLLEDSVGHYTKRADFMKFESPVPSGLIRGFHKKFVALALGSIEGQAIKDRKVLTSVFQVRKVDFALARRDLENFNNDFVRKYSSGAEQDDVVCLTVQLFKLTGDKE
ncbi:MAG: TIGR02147 family protein [Proteobacteria bacterium]|nr:MAG: TIGR02147 family protein [Pseudomonadota bacterium]